MIRTCFPVASALSLLVLFSTMAVAAENELTAEEVEQGWELLFNGTDHTGWKCNNGQEVQSEIENEALAPLQSGGYLIIHEREFGDFILRCDVKMGEPHCNSGIFIRIGDLSNPVHTAMEVQVLHGDGVGVHEFGGIFDLAPSTVNATKEAGEWNAVEICCRGPQITIHVNGQEVCSLNCDETTEPGQRPDGTPHKFKIDGEPIAISDFPRRGHFGFQDHGHDAWFRNIRVLELEPTSEED